MLLLVYAGSVLCPGFKNEGPESHPGKSNSSYAGADACCKCHEDIYDSFISTAHHLTSSPGSATFIKDNFDSGHNRFFYPVILPLCLSLQGHSR